MAVTLSLPCRSPRASVAPHRTRRTALPRLSLLLALLLALPAAAQANERFCTALRFVTSSALWAASSGTAVITTNDPATCAVVDDGGVWWKVDDGSGPQRGPIGGSDAQKTPVFHP